MDLDPSLTYDRLVVDPLQAVAETEAFIARCNRLGLSEAERAAIIDQVAADPRAGDLVKGSGGLRKVRFGGRGGYRVLVAYFDEATPAYLLSVIAKGQQANFTDAQINALRELVRSIKRERR